MTGPGNGTHHHNSHHPNHPNHDDKYHHVMQRLATFEGQWPHEYEVSPTPRLLAENGFILESIGSNPDRTACVYCGCVLRRWKDGDLVAVAHAEAARLRRRRCPLLESMRKAEVSKVNGDYWAGVRRPVEDREKVLDQQTFEGIARSEAGLPEHIVGHMSRELYENKKAVVELCVGTKARCEAVMALFTVQGMECVITANPYKVVERKRTESAAAVAEEATPKNRTAPVTVYFTNHDSDLADTIRAETAAATGGTVFVHEMELPSGAADELRKLQLAQNMRVVACGGNGTVAWVLQGIQEANMSHEPTVSVVPRGRNNDLAKYFGWNKSSAVDALATNGGEICNCDAWSLITKPAKVQGKKADPRMSQHTVTSPFICSASIGVAALVALVREEARRRHEAVNAGIVTRTLGELWEVHARSGADQAPPFCELYQLLMDGSPVDVPPHVRGVVFLNIPYFQGRPVKSAGVACDDGKLEVLGVTGAMALAAGRFVNLGQARAVAVKPLNDHPLFLEIDGDASHYPASAVTIIHNKPFKMARRSNK